VWSVEERDSLPSERKRNPDLLGDGIGAGRLDHRAKIGPERSEVGDILSTAEEYELRVLVEPRQVAQEIPDVRTDPEVVELSGIDSDAHREIIAGLSQSDPCKPE
jgi:hypothetical protein